ncbi:MAG: diacylglycerol kinase family protein [Ornithinimicrobium sp.]
MTSTSDTAASTDTDAYPSSSVLVIANAAAGSAEDADVDRVLSTLSSLAETDVVIPDGDDGMAKALRSANGRDIVVMGGDGSLHWVLQSAYEHDLLSTIGAVGLVPMGTGNDFARGMGLPLDLMDAARIAVEGEKTEADLLVDEDGAVVVNVAHVGIAAAATQHAEGVKDAIGAAGYAAGALTAGVSSRGWEVVVHVDGEEVLDKNEDALLVSLALGSSVGGGTTVAPDASHTDRKVDIVVATGIRVRDRAGFAADLRRGTHAERDDVTVYHGTEVTVASVDPDKDFITNVDGDLGPRHHSRTWKLQPAAWVCRVPSSTVEH